jgi:hypothetical protein
MSARRRIMRQAAATSTIESFGIRPEPFRSRLVPADGESAEIRRIGWLTPESVDSLVEDSRLCGRGARLEIRLSESDPHGSRAWLTTLRATLRRRGVSVEVIDESAATKDVARELLSSRLHLRAFSTEAFQGAAS